RDNEYYRIVFMPDNKWWLAQNLKYATNGQLRSGCDKDSCGMFYLMSDVYKGDYSVNQQKNCPAGWVLPSDTQWADLAASINPSVTIAWQDMRCLQTPCTPKTDRFGWATRGRCALNSEPDDGDAWHACSGTTPGFAQLDNGAGVTVVCNSTMFWINIKGLNNTQPAAIRCLRP
ncbi:MAG: hypothetical protein LBU42_05595, partial [Prevotellaceae bacterium]|nr:hypothetical protein [Prevotellaceae bacterium]